MMFGPHRCDDPTTSRRHLDCVHVMRCLTTAERAGWPAFSCGDCYQRIDSFQRAMDFEGLTALRLTVEALK